MIKSLLAFEKHYYGQQKGLDKVAFYLGLQFVETSLLEIPKHGYYYSNKFESQKLHSMNDTYQTLKILQSIVDRHKVYLSKEQPKLDKLQFLCNEQKQNNWDTYEMNRAQVEKELQLMYPPQKSPRQQVRKRQDNPQTVNKNNDRVVLVV